MSFFREVVDSPPGSRFVLQGNSAFALGVVHAGFHAADGYPGTPSTEVIDKNLSLVQDRIQVGWSVSEAVAMGVGVGHVLAGRDTVITMKIPGVFQAGDPITTSAFYTGQAGALVIYAVADYVPSSTQHVIDARYFFSAARVPVLEPRDHQELYRAAALAADLSRKHACPVAILASGILAHSDGLIHTAAPRTVAPRSLPATLHEWMLMPGIARRNYDQATTVRIPALREWAETGNIADIEPGRENWGILACGMNRIIVKEALHRLDRSPWLMSLAMPYPLAVSRIKQFVDQVKGPVFVIEDGYRFVQEQLTIAGIQVQGKPADSTITFWTPEGVMDYLAGAVRDVTYEKTSHSPGLQPVKRPPSICPGCPYRAFALAVGKLKKQGKMYAVFGDIGCSTLLYFLNALDTVLCMGASDSMRQGFVLSRPDMAGKVISVLGDSTECHSGMDATRNAVFRNVPGVKVILDNRITAMTGGQPAPSSPVNLAGEAHNFDLKRAVAAEGVPVREADAYNLKQVEQALTDCLQTGANGSFQVLLLRGACVQQVDGTRKRPRLRIDYDKCKRCGLCNICPGIMLDENKTPRFTPLCTNCGGSEPVCLQRCPFGAIVPIQEVTHAKKRTSETLAPMERATPISADALPSAIRVAIRGVGGQGNLFFGKVLVRVMQKTPFQHSHIVKGDTHGMAQLGGSVISVFSCGEVFSPVLAPGSADVLVAMERAEVLQPGFLDLLKSGGTVVLNDFAIPPASGAEHYPQSQAVRDALKGFRLYTLDAYAVAREAGDPAGRTANAVVIGLLSRIAPFDSIPQGVWEQALADLSPKAHIQTANIQSFRKGRSLHD